MTVTLFRIAADTATYTADDLSGKGAEITGGRWNEKGTPLVYAATTRALAYVETLVHLDGSKPLPLNRYLIEINVPDDAWANAAVCNPAANVGWDALPASITSIRFGTNWAAGGSSLLVMVPSVVTPEELNVLINPKHPDIAKVKAKNVRKWTYDHRAHATV